MNGWLTAVLFILCRRWYPLTPVTWSAAVAVGTVVCTNCFFYATSVEHRVVAVVLICTALWICEALTGPFAPLLFGACLGLSIATSYESAILLPSLLYWSLRNHKRTGLLRAGLGLVIPVISLLVYQAACFGSSYEAHTLSALIYFQYQGFTGINTAFALPFIGLQWRRSGRRRHFTTCCLGPGFDFVLFRCLRFAAVCLFRGFGGACDVMLRFSSSQQHAP